MSIQHFWTSTSGVLFLLAANNLFALLILPSICCQAHIVKDTIKSLRLANLWLIWSNVFIPRSFRRGLQVTASVSDNNRHVNSVYRALIVAALGTGILFSLTVLLGAPLFQLVEKTFLLALYLSLSSLTPLAALIRLDTADWARIIFRREFLSEPEKLLAYNMYGTLIGAYLGAIPIPLDWDRPWQAWPITCVLGGLCGTITTTLLLTSAKFCSGRRNDETSKAL